MGERNRWWTEAKQRSHWCSWSSSLSAGCWFSGMHVLRLGFCVVYSSPVADLDVLSEWDETMLGSLYKKGHRCSHGGDGGGSHSDTVGELNPAPDNFHSWSPKTVRLNTWNFFLTVDSAIWQQKWSSLKDHGGPFSSILDAVHSWLLSGILLCKS